jgi:hypothetical protein
MQDRKTYRYAIVGIAAALAVFLIGASTIAAIGHEVPKELWTIGTALGGGLLGVLVPRPQASPGAKPIAESTTIQNAASQAASDAAAQPPAHATPREGETPEQAVTRVQSKAAAALAQVNDVSNLKQAIDASTGSPGSGAAGVVLAIAHDKAAKDKEAAAQASTDASQQDELNAEARVYAAAAAAAQSKDTLAEAKQAGEKAPKGYAVPWDYIGKLAPPLLVFVVALALGETFTGKMISFAEYKKAVALAGSPEAMKQYLEGLVRHQQALISEGNALLALATAAGGALVGVLAPSPGEKSASSSASAKT